MSDYFTDLQKIQNNDVPPSVRNFAGRLKAYYKLETCCNQKYIFRTDGTGQESLPEVLDVIRIIKVKRKFADDNEGRPLNRRNRRANIHADESPLPPRSHPSRHRLPFLGRRHGSRFLPFRCLFLTARRLN
ncbi:hypothetical protein BC938DRAFT_479837 [Jimgerdemannia flammicorona]|uniref:Uncharacterized protein n=1 Tax=Jimgerdemannia flammicorona TaxID=994334 RepID=A0A433QK03_9FUNG|nr:hypothetical protein BC938DRAFT_479837 [Jimgerdemannia flammicorona]